MSTVLITGGHAGLGLIGAQTLAMRFGCNLILAARNPGKAGGAADKLRTETGVRVEVLEMDLNSLASVRRAAEQCKTMLKVAPAADERASRDDMGVAFTQAHEVYRMRRDAAEAQAVFLALIDKGTIGIKAAMEGTLYV